MFKTRYLLLLFLSLTLAQESLAADYILVVNKENPVHTLDSEMVKKIFLGKRNFWEDGHRIEVFLQPENELHEKFIKDVLKKSTRQFKMYWRRELYSGTGLPPQKLEDDAKIKEAVASDPRAIGYIAADSFDDSVKWVRITKETN
ncbi:phosphate ABC transporter substrate-binding protein, PhoT family [Malonomonas rubra DSM 5091]|uniref:Phosphate ABC transporter substrate-binding protein, PhoT family n=1 Tax=Malonomonas rubra DSM 5091 TaxID=1122189 RepID=A0A1M6DIH1_MALRU|nr:hypothetical protein [Malonomonas rubra]SHI72798.1 phosphate ABC transporter substrate-binding protein, PhoT family [Malonomonas rubra DSM 5091]